MEPTRRLRPSAACLAGAAGFLWFLLRFHAAALDVTNVGWLMAGDWGQNEMGWLFFRGAPWGFPVGHLPPLLAPVGSSIALTDATPLVSLLLKPFSPLLPQAFQFIGPWLALCFTLQGVAGALLTSLFTREVWRQTLGGCLFVLAPVLDLRTGHASLCAHWLLLVALWLALRPVASGKITGRLFGQVGWVALCTVVHPYLWAMVTVVAFAHLWRLHRERRAGTGPLLATSAAMLTASLLAFWCLGLIGHSVGTGAVGFGAYNSDLLTLVDSAGYSRLLPSFPIAPGQLEGAGFLGVGTLALLVGGLVWGWPRRAALAADERTRWRPVWVAAGLLALFAVASVVTVGGFRILSMRTLLRLLEPLTGPFRASGRFIWPLHYALLTAALALTLRRWPRGQRAAWVLAAAVALQALDARRTPMDTRPTTRWNRLPSPRWDALAQGRAHLVVYPTQLHVGGGEGCQYEDAHPANFYLSADWLAYRHGMTVNSGYASRVDSRAMQAACAGLIASVRSGRLAPDTLYLVADGWNAEFLRRPGVSCERLDGQLGCVLKDGGAGAPSDSARRQ